MDSGVNQLLESFHATNKYQFQFFVNVFRRTSYLNLFAVTKQPLDDLDEVMQIIAVTICDSDSGSAFLCLFRQYKTSRFHHRCISLQDFKSTLNSNLLTSMHLILIPILLTSVINAKVVPRDGNTLSFPGDTLSSLVSIALPTSLSGNPNPSLVAPSSSDTNDASTVTILLPSPATVTTTTVPACTKANGEIIPPIIVIGLPADTFSPGITRTIPVVPQAEPTTVTYYGGPPSNGTEVVVIEPLPGVCGAFVAPDATPTEDSPSSSPTADACPNKGCSGAVSRAAETVIDAINEVTQLSMLLQKAAKKIGEAPVSVPVPGLPRPTLAVGDEADMSLLPGGPIIEVSTGLGRITLSVSVALPTFQTFPPFVPGCSAHTIVLAWLEFVRVHQELLAIIIGRSGLLERGPIKRDGAAAMVARAEQGFVGRPIAAALRKLEAVVDTLAVGIVDLVPNKSECTKQKSAELKKSIQKAETSYDG